MWNGTGRWNPPLWERPERTFRFLEDSLGRPFCSLLPSAMLRRRAHRHQTAAAMFREKLKKYPSHPPLPPPPALLLLPLCHTHSCAQANAPAWTRGGGGGSSSDAADAAEETGSVAFFLLYATSVGRPVSFSFPLATRSLLVWIIPSKPKVNAGRTYILLSCRASF